MNKAILMGRLTKDPEIRYTQAEQPLAVGRYTLAIDRQGKEKNTDYVSCVVFGSRAEFAGKYLKKGTKIAVVGRIQTGSYVNKEGNKVYTTDVVVEEHYFAEKKAGASDQQGQDPEVGPDGFYDGSGLELPFT